MLCAYNGKFGGRRVKTMKERQTVNGGIRGRERSGLRPTGAKGRIGEGVRKKLRRGSRMNGGEMGDRIGEMGSAG